MASPTNKKQKAIKGQYRGGLFLKKTTSDTAMMKREHFASL